MQETLLANISSKALGHINFISSKALGHINFISSKALGHIFYSI